MDRHKVGLLIHTLKYLKPKQFSYRLFYFVRNRFFKKNYSKTLTSKVQSLVWKDGILNPNSFLGNQKFVFLNIEHKFDNKIDWNLNDYGKLWSFNINYFDFLNQQSLSVEDGISLIKDYIDQDDVLTDGKASYPISLRGINWVKFLSKHKIEDTQINQSLYNHFQLLYHNPEYHLLGNHLLENGFALLFGAYYFNDEVLYKEACKIVKNELNEQILEDGAHFELSTMYHQTMLFRVLDCIQLVKLNNWKNDDIQVFLEEKAIKMLAWLSEVTFRNGDIPMVNDSAFGIAPKSNKLFNYAEELKLIYDRVQLSDSGYRIYKNDLYELFVDVGNVGASYQPAHVHSDTFNFVLYANDKPLIVDTGITTYEKNNTRQKERGTAAHNTVQLGIEEQTQVWAGFRVAKRAKITNLIEGDDFVEAAHDGYSSIGASHTRKFTSSETKIVILDQIKNHTEHKEVAHFHFHPDIENLEIDEKRVSLVNEKIYINFESDFVKIEKDKYEFSIGYNKTVEAYKIKVHFKTNLETEIQL